MTIATLYVMLIWASTGQGGGPAVLQNFSSLEACERNRSVVEANLPVQKGIINFSSVRTKCVSINNQ